MSNLPASNGLHPPGSNGHADTYRQPLDPADLENAATCRRLALGNRVSLRVRKLVLSSPAWRELWRSIHDVANPDTRIDWPHEFARFKLGRPDEASQAVGGMMLDALAEAEAIVRAEPHDDLEDGPTAGRRRAGLLGDHGIGPSGGPPGPFRTVR